MSHYKTCPQDSTVNTSKAYNKARPLYSDVTLQIGKLTSSALSINTLTERKCNDKCIWL